MENVYKELAQKNLGWSDMFRTSQWLNIKVVQISKRTWMIIHGVLNTGYQDEKYGGQKELI